MTEWRIYKNNTVPPVSTFEFHAERERAPHLEQGWHRVRLLRAADLIREAAAMLPGPVGVSDLGCGDGGLLSVIHHDLNLDCWGYDFQPSNQDGWAERGVQAEALDVFNGGQDKACVGDIAVVTEVLEHIADPHGALRWIAQHAQFLVASSPALENDVHHDECHAWAWDVDGYRQLVEDAGFEVLVHELIVNGTTQILLARRAA